MPREGARYQGTRSQEEAKEDEEAYEEATSTLRGLLNKYAEGKNGYQNLHRMMSSRTYPITRKKGDKEVQDKTEDGTKQNDNLQKTEAKGGKSKDRTEEGENKDHTRVFGKTHTGTIAKDLAEDGENKDLAEDGENKDHTGVFIKTHTGKIAKDLDVKINPPYPQHTTGGARQGEVHGDDLDLDKRQGKNHTRRCAKDVL